MTENSTAKLKRAGPEIERLRIILVELNQPGQAERLKTLYERSQEEALRVVALGAFNQGKSTLVNALIGAKVLPVALVPTTAVMTRVVSALPAGATLYYADGRPSHEVSLEEVSEHLTLDASGKPRPALKLIEVRCPWRPAQAMPLDLYDTPGFNDLLEQAQAAREATEQADLLLFMLNARQPLTEQEENIWQSWAASSGVKTIFLLNFLNLLEEEDREAASERVKQALSERFNPAQEPELLQINALLALRARLRNDAKGLAESGLPELAARLDYYAGEGREALLEATRLRRLQKVLNELLRENQTRLNAAETSWQDWQARQAQAEQWSKCFNQLENHKTQSLAEFEFRLLAELENAVEWWPLPQLGLQVQELVGQRMREWLTYFEQESNRTLAAFSASARPFKFNCPAAPVFNYTYKPPSPVYNNEADLFEAPLDFLGNAVRGLGQFANSFLENGLDPRQERRERVIAHARLSAFVHETVARLEQQVSGTLATGRISLAPKAPPPFGLEPQIILRRELNNLLTSLVTKLS